ncbi:MAG: bifunctional metallophosphatase/5'-nucleotidase [Eubacteriaceae bacterium]|nr:bifunctional metallophosphatase/5'-nucleotidase [Eubacteriaceae bacterium]
MKRELKQLLSFLVVMLMLLSIIPLSAYAEEETVGPDTTAGSQDESLTGTSGTADQSQKYNGKVIILHTNDVHGAIDRYAYVAGLRQDFLDKGADAVILVDAGDYSQGTIYVSENEGMNGVVMMNAVGYDYASIGNHEFDYGMEAAMTNLDASDFTVLCCNMFMEDGSAVSSKLQPSSMWSSPQGLNIGFVGAATPETRTKANPAKIKGLVVDGDTKILTDIRLQTEYLRSNDADVIILISHLGINDASSPYRSLDVWNELPGEFAFIIDGHSHAVMEEGPDHEPIQSTGSGLVYIGVVIIDTATKSIEDNYLYKIDDDSPKDDDIYNLAKGIMDDIDEQYSQVFAGTEVFLDGRREMCRTQETNLGDLVADAMLWSVKSQGGLELPEENYVALVNGGGIRANLPQTSAPDSIVGDISRKDVHTVLPFGNTVTVVYVTGAQLLEALEASTFCSPSSLGGFPQVSGMKYVIDINRKYDPNDETYPGSTYYGPKTINRVSITEINGKPFDPAATYAVVTNDFCSSGGDTYYALTGASIQFDTGIPVDEALMAYINTVLGGVIDSRYGSAGGRIAYTEPEPVDPTAPTYDYIAGYGQSVDRTKDDGASFRIDAPFDAFVKLLIDGSETDPSTYSVYEGSTVVVLSKQLLNSLSTGKHTITAVFREAETSAPFTVEDSSQDSAPYTGLYTGMRQRMIGLMAAAAMILFIALRRRQTN